MFESKTIQIFNPTVSSQTIAWLLKLHKLYYFVNFQGCYESYHPWDKHSQPQSVNCSWQNKIIYDTLSKLIISLFMFELEMNRITLSYHFMCCLIYFISLKKGDSVVCVLQWVCSLTDSEPFELIALPHRNFKTWINNITHTSYVIIWHRQFVSVTCHDMTKVVCVGKF